jgi:hypothetical protein
MANSPESWQPMLDRLMKLRSAWPGNAWAWDARFKCVAASFGKEIDARVREAMVGALPNEWSSATIDSASDDIRALSSRYGGVRTGQLVFTGESGDRSLLYGLWWPWGDGSTISLRVGVANCDRPTELFPLVRAVFNIT